MGLEIYHTIRYKTNIFTLQNNCSANETNTHKEKLKRDIIEVSYLQTRDMPNTPEKNIGT